MSVLNVLLSKVVSYQEVMFQISIQTSCAEAENDTIAYFEEINTVMFSSRTIELVEFLESLVMYLKTGDRPVRRYFDSYSTPFHGFDEIVFSNRAVLLEEAMYSRTIELVEFLESLVMYLKTGDRPVRRYFDSYSTPFHGFDEIVFSNRAVLLEEAM
uniref:Uncharacterized protein n=1 Tax=Heliothis virescens TaxID=7102 RepID=A0A2A4J6Z5_HELVI